MHLVKWLGLGFIMGGLVVSACGNDSGGPVLETDEEDCLQASFNSIYQLVSSQQCAVSGCHAGENAAGQLDFSDDEAAVYVQLVNSPTIDAEAVGEFPTRVAPNDVNRSYFFHIISDANPLGSSLGRMPPGGSLLDCEVEAIGDWISSGATQD